MSLRSYRDDRGISWLVWSIPPRFAPVRSGVERRTQRIPFERERRVAVERRRHPLSQSLLQGWLCFESDSERRRLTPIPTDWSECDEAALAQYCTRAVPVRRFSHVTTTS